MNERDQAKVSSKLHYGPGGVACQCCNPYNCHPRKMKKLARRLVRRVEKNNMVKGEIND